MSFNSYTTGVTSGAGFELTTFVLISTDCTGSCKSNYHIITTMKAPNKQRGKNVIFDQIKVDGLQYDLRSELNCFALGVLRGNKLVIVRIGVYMYYSGNLHF